jgi:hypothetical protein
MKRFISFALLLTLSTTLVAQSLFVNENSWLCGKWSSTDLSNKESILVRSSKSEFKGFSCQNTIKTQKNEIFNIYLVNGKWLLSILTHEEKIIHLELKGYSTEYMRFERSNKEYPSQIIFETLDENILLVSREGLQNGEMQSNDSYLFRSEENQAFQYQATAYREADLGD